MSAQTKPGEAANGWCPECGPARQIDEDGCCPGCGNGATGVGATKALRCLADATLQRAEQAVVRAAVATERLRKAMTNAEPKKWERAQLLWMRACEAESLAVSRLKRGKR